LNKLELIMTKTPDYSGVNQSLTKHYTTLHAIHGDDFKAAQYSDKASQEARFAILSEIGITPTSSILDFGCGLGDLLGFLRRAIGYRGRYVGYDLSPEVVRTAQAKYDAVGADARFEVRDIFKDPPVEDIDFTVICGTFNINFGDNGVYIRRVLSALFPRCRQGLALNLMSTYVDFQDPGLYYADPEEIFAYCKTELSSAVSLRHDYILKSGGIPFEFAVYIRRVDAAPRRKFMSSAL
jgi:SAM-dependent methyltransferase